MRLINLAILLTCYNRKEKTLSALEKLFMQEGLTIGIEMTVYVVDDGSSDGTSAAIAECFPQVKLLQGTGNLYWNGGMRLAFGEALKADYDYYLWLNDDTTLFSTALARLLDISMQLGDKTIVVASIQDPYSSQLTYGGVRRLHRSKPLKFTSIAPGESPMAVETMNGNCVLIPQVVAKTVGNLDPAFIHGIGDFDYGLRARKLGLEIYLAPGFYGHCQRNQAGDKKLPFKAHWKKLLSPLGLPPRGWAVFAQRYGGPFWFIFWASPYFRNIIHYLSVEMV